VWVSIAKIAGVVIKVSYRPHDEAVEKKRGLRCCSKKVPPSRRCPPGTHNWVRVEIMPYYILPKNTRKITNFRKRVIGLDCECNGELAKEIAEQVKAGDHVFVEGYLDPPRAIRRLKVRVVIEKWRKTSIHEVSGEITAEWITCRSGVNPILSDIQPVKLLTTENGRRFATPEKLP
jgi:hypothetical protein